MNKKIANCIHHTHWDLIWYFTVQDAATQFSYNMKELLSAFDEKEIERFYLDGQTAPIDEYLRMFPEDEKKIKEYIKEGKLIIGPFNSQLDCFITSGESVINNLRLGINTSKKLGKVSNIAYLPDSFGHSIDFPKIFNQFGIKDFVITRGVGDEYGLDSEFYWESEDGSKLLVYTMIAGYGYGCYAFKNGNLFTDEAVDYNKIDVKKLMDRLLSYSTVDHEFVFPLGFDQNPMVHGIKERIEEYNNIQDEIRFIETTWQEYFEKIRNSPNDLKIHRHELISPQYHRVHRSIYSGRADVKALQDKCERILTFELQPLMTILDSLGISYNHGLLDKTWETLVLCQTHSSANLTDETNDYIERETKNALNLAISHKQYLLKLLSISLDKKTESENYLTVFSVYPEKHQEIIRATVFTKNRHFNLYQEGKKVAYTITNTERENNGVLRKDYQLINEEKFYYKTDIIFLAEDLPGLSYTNYLIVEEEDSSCTVPCQTVHYIENEFYKIAQTENGISIFNKETNKVLDQAIYIEDSGDEGDSFDYSYPNEDWKLNDYMDGAHVTLTASSLVQTMEIDGSMEISSNLLARKRKTADCTLGYQIKIELEKESPVILLSGCFNNEGEQHRVRLIFKGEEKNEYSYAGTQYSMIQRKTKSSEEQYWREKGYFEEPSPIYPLLNHVSAIHSNQVMTVYTRSSKEYEFVNDGFKDIGVTIFRSYGALGYPDLNRRPGRPSGLDYMVFETPKCQMMGKNYFELGVTYTSEFKANKVFKNYVRYATDPIAYQGQPFDKSIYPIDYFPTNPLPFKLPLSYCFMEIESGEGVFGSIVKSDTEKSYLMRLYNSENQKINGGKINSFENQYNLSKTNLAETKVQDLEKNKVEILQPSEFTIIKIEK